MSETQNATDGRLHILLPDSHGSSIHRSNPPKQPKIDIRNSSKDNREKKQLFYSDNVETPKSFRADEALHRSSIRNDLTFHRMGTGARESIRRARPKSKSSVSESNNRRLSPLPRNPKSLRQKLSIDGKENDRADKSAKGNISDSKRIEKKSNQPNNIMVASTLDLDEKIIADEDEKKYVVPKIEMNPEMVGKNLRSNDRRRRNSVSAESLDDEGNTYQDYKRRIYPKSDGTLRAIHESCTTSFLFQGIDAKRRKDMYDAMYSRSVQAGDVICKQGEASCAFYVIESGEYQARTTLSKREKEQVFEFHNRGVFGEYALMYNTGQNATIICISSGILWILDKNIFMRGLFLGQRRRHALYDDFVRKLNFLNDLPQEAKKRIPDCLQTRIYQKDEWIIQQGDREARGFYIIEEGSVVVTQIVKGVEREIRRLETMDYFGEVALVQDSRRTANIKVLSERCIVVRMDKAWFFQLLGPLIKTTFQGSLKTYRQALATDKVAPGITANLALWDLLSSESEESDYDRGI